MAEPEEGAAPEPWRTAELRGHRAAETRLIEALRAGRLHHALMLTGPGGIGKATLAYRLAAFLFEHGAPNDPHLAAAADLAVPDDARARRLIAARAHPDLVVLSAANEEEPSQRGEIKVGQVRRGLERLSGTAAGTWRVCIVDAADDLNRHAANAILKALEEPPPRTVFVLVAHRPGRLIPTVRSRCTRIELSPLGSEDMAAALAAATVAEGEIAEVAALAPGRPGEALRLNAAGARALGEALAGVLADLPRLDLEAVHRLADAYGPARADAQFRLLMELVGAWLEAAVRTGLTGSAARHGLLPPPPPMGEGSGALEPYLALWEKVGDETRAALTLNLDRKLLILNTIFGIAAAAEKAAPRPEA